MNTLQLILYVTALVLLVLAAVGVGAPRVSLGWAGVACWLTAAVFVPMLT